MPKQKIRFNMPVPMIVMTVPAFTMPDPPPAA